MTFWNDLVWIYINTSIGIRRSFRVTTKDIEFGLNHRDLIRDREVSLVSSGQDTTIKLSMCMLKRDINDRVSESLGQFKVTIILTIIVSIEDR